MQLRMAIVGAALAAGCGDATDGAASPEYESGARLRAKRYDAGGGAVAFGGWRDSALNLNCAFRLMDDDTWRCVPVSQVTVGFADPACRQMIVVDFTAATCAAPERAFETIPERGCAPTQVRMRRVGARLSDGPLFLQTPRGCEDYSALAPYQRFVAGGALPVDEFVAATPTLEPRGGGLAVIALTAADGAHDLAELVDAERGPCTLYDLTPETLTCVANLGVDGAEHGLFVDDACATSAPAVYQACPDRQPGVVRVADGFHLPGAAIAGPVYDDRSGTCSANDDLVAYALGPALDPVELPTIGRTELGTGRLRSRHLTDAHGRPIRSAEFYDTVEQSECDVVMAAGALRCLPETVTQWDTPTTLFADPACSVRVIALERGGLERVATMAPWCGGPRQATALHRVAPYSAELYASSSSGACTPVARQPTLRYFADAAALPLDALPVITARIE